MSSDTAAKIAVVDDDVDVMKLVEQVLTSGGYRVVSTCDSTAAVELIRREEPDLVLCDIAMPIMDGYAVVRALQADPETAKYPVVFFTAHREFTERVQAFRFGVVDYIIKPFTREILLRRIERLLRSLDQRSGILRPSRREAGVDGILEDAQRESRSGVLSVEGPAGGSRVLIRAGEVVERTPPTATQAATGAEFQELDPRREDIVSHDPPRLPGRAELPLFESVPELLRTVLVVDDNSFFRQFLKTLLLGQGFSVYEASDGVEGLQQALAQRPWLILTDVRMPGLDGVEFCRRVRDHSLIRHTPIVFLSGWDDYKERYRSLEAGGDEFLSKDTPVRELMIRIHLILKRFANLGGPGRREAESAMKGRLDLVGAPGVLQMCHLGRLCGILSVTSGKRGFQIGFRDGEIVSAKGSQTHGVDAVYEFLGWTRGQFEFTETDPGPDQSLGESFDQILLEGCRRLDETGR